MKEIKAYIRPERADDVISHLEDIGVKGMTVIDVSMMGSWVNPKESKVSMEYCEKYCKVVKIEMVCEEDLLEIAVQSILDHSHSGQRGDGKIFISNIDDAISIRTKSHGVEALD